MSYALRTGMREAMRALDQDTKDLLADLHRNREITMAHAKSVLERMELIPPGSMKSFRRSWDAVIK